MDFSTKMAKITYSVNEVVFQGCPFRHLLCSSYSPFIHQLRVQAYIIDNDRSLKETEMLTCSTVRAAFPIRYSSITTGDHRTGDLATHSSRVLQKKADELLHRYIIAAVLAQCATFMLFMISI